MSDNSMPINLIIKELRKTAHITQRELAEKVGLTQQAVALIENGQRRVAVDLFIKILNVFDNLSSAQFAIAYANANIDASKLNKLNTIRLLSYWTNDEVAAKSDMIINFFEQLNDTGQDKAIEQVELLTKIPEYQKGPEK